MRSKTREKFMTFLLKLSFSYVSKLFQLHPYLVKTDA